MNQISATEARDISARLDKEKTDEQLPVIFDSIRKRAAAGFDYVSVKGNVADGTRRILKEQGFTVSQRGALGNCYFYVNWKRKVAR